MEPLIIIVLAFSAISVFRAEEFLFVRKGRSVRLDVQGYEGLRFHTLYWKFNSKETILEYSNKYKGLTSFEDYENRTEFDQKNFTLLLKNVQERDSGIYTAEITDAKGKDRDVASYRLTVQEAPPTPEVGVALLSSAGGFCKVSVNCSANDTWASYTCNHAHCTKVANTTLSTEVKITVTATKEAISCSSSNRVGTKMQSKSTKHVCTPINENNQGESWGVTVGVIVGVIVAAVISITVFVIYKKRRKSGGSQIQERCNTEYASVEGPAVVLRNPSTVETMHDAVTTANPECHLEVSTVYDVLGPAGDPPTQPESIYAAVNKVAS
ncbi:natural killer cell receptor 2B4-like isoform X3 [Anguilla anguilla]|uniref:natural killer cell receptor 2B4-like isoform X3 n=1 Tax=Anguilla anguilla TaxID=7936 RepID=UPI0015B0414B|nr:natural killer cell receptor 2B4-like isoform X3 [Anguilla anguilla]